MDPSAIRIDGCPPPSGLLVQLYTPIAGGAGACRLALYRLALIDDRQVGPATIETVIIVVYHFGLRGWVEEKAMQEDEPAIHSADQVPAGAKTPGVAAYAREVYIINNCRVLAL